MNKWLWLTVFITTGSIIGVSGAMVKNSTQGSAIAQPIQTPAPTSVPLTNESTTTAQPQSGIGQNEQQLISLVEKDMSKLTGANKNTMQLLESSQVDWSDSSLGCPKEGFAYLQVITPGYKLIYRVGNEIFEYHTDSNDTIVLCERKRA